MNTPTKIYEKYDVVKVPFPFTDVKGVKIRPALVISSIKYFNAKIGMSVMAMITSVKHSQHLWPTDIVIQDLEHTGLPFSSLIRFKLFTLDHRLVLESIGSLSKRDRLAVQDQLNEIFEL